ncbi:MAG: hypothetical protein AVDCRST_MAG22-2279 [uncultured Rubrobacteraceae bacterium]|uniref:Uncharacterized protein n=1 Tax=uncultured Rubrobacteraceae bacterium TaxID=349277 RepID=A0A6J4PMK0_9ACTN|nr:MAG: hypothetical protein AVDCRST_MAG22-2279 [uncultured Rubrobacteraceae bacterium]
MGARTGIRGAARTEALHGFGRVSADVAAPPCDGVCVLVRPGTRACPASLVFVGCWELTAL